MPRPGQLLPLPALWLCTLLWVSAPLAMSARAAVPPMPYTADVDTLHLWHLDGGTVPASDAGTNTFALAGLLNGAEVGAASAAGFGTALNTHTGSGTELGILALAAELLGDSGDTVPAGFQWFGADGAFTLEALLHLDVLPRDAPGGALDIITMEGDGTADRIFNFRIEKSESPDLVLLALPGSGFGSATFSAPVPLTGAHALATGTWFHAAVTYDGDPGAAGNLRFYWTRLDTGAVEAQLLGTGSLPADFGSGLGAFALGNDARAFNDESEGFPGRLDEVRISGSARAAHEFVFRSVAIEDTTAWDADYVPANTLDGDLSPGSRWSSYGDGAYLTFDLGRVEVLEAVEIAFYLGDVRTATFDLLVSRNKAAWEPVLSSVTSAPTVELQAFAVPTNTLARYVRFVGHGNTQNDWNSLTEVVIHRSPPADADGDGLPDLWELAYFGDLDETVPGDPDGDLLANVYELEHGLDPTEPNAMDDADNDGLSDAWEMHWFGSLGAEDADGDPDRDGFSNLAEYQHGGDPTNPNSVPGDTDGDSLPDDWEMAALGTLGYWAYEDPDHDGYHNVAERAANTSPTNALAHPPWSAPRVALLNDSVVDPDALLMPSGATYGRAINGVSFQQLPISFNGYQYVAWYDTQGTDQSLRLARRSVAGLVVGPWESFDTGSNLTRGDEGSWDAHNVIAIGIDATDGTLHVSWDHHGHDLRYRRSAPGLCTTDLGAWGPAALYPEQNWLVAAGQTVSGVTYPRFFNTPDGGLRFAYRTGSTSAGENWLHAYRPAAGNWSAGRKFATLGGTFTGLSVNGGTFTSTSRNAYENGYEYGADGVLHYTWTYREATANPCNHDIHYAWSADDGVTWRNSAGELIADTPLGEAIRVDSPGIVVKVIDMRQHLINQQAQAVDADGRVHVLMLHRRAEPGFEWVLGDPAFSTEDTAYYHYFREPADGTWHQRRLPVDWAVGARPKIGADASGNLYAVYVANDGMVSVPGYGAGSLVVASASRAALFTDWAIVAVIPIAFTGEPLLDTARLRNDNILSVFVQESGPASSSPMGTDLHVYDFVVALPDAPVGLDLRGDDVLITFATEAEGAYAVQSTTDLRLGDWTTVSLLLSGIDGRLAVPHVGAASAPRRYYRVQSDP